MGKHELYNFSKNDKNRLKFLNNFSHELDDFVLLSEQSIKKLYDGGIVKTNGKIYTAKELYTKNVHQQIFKKIIPVLDYNINTLNIDKNIDISEDEINRVSKMFCDYYSSLSKFHYNFFLLFPSIYTKLLLLTINIKVIIEDIDEYSYIAPKNTFQFLYDLADKFMYYNNYKNIDIFNDAYFSIDYEWKILFSEITNEEEMKVVNELYNELIREKKPDKLKNEFMVHYTVLTLAIYDAFFLNQFRYLTGYIDSKNTYSYINTKNMQIDIYKHYSKLVEMLSKEYSIKDLNNKFIDIIKELTTFYNASKGIEYYMIFLQPTINIVEEVFSTLDITGLDITGWDDFLSSFLFVDIIGNEDCDTKVSNDYYQLLRNIYMKFSSDNSKDEIDKLLEQYKKDHEDELNEYFYNSLRKKEILISKERFLGIIFLYMLNYFDKLKNGNAVTLYWLKAWTFLTPLYEVYYHVYYYKRCAKDDEVYRVYIDKLSKKYKSLVNLFKRKFKRNAIIMKKKFNEIIEFLKSEASS